ncbi:hypothetical protein [Aureibacter tunicatorum]|uniref:Uncharacterized protein n=1 Tax=Aureibacter tunicatorum TaxID=866807 RepID=A0AAE3XNE7_9BACT|nr:hypothetical protein [Aureibacter tunicatorum]MDR6241131.1 hypothetical protein [Aureibacter tunicatorum]BDD03909.1 hypothetical protein AUTU_13920 [Aureibacter tunicatorum]
MKTIILILSILIMGLGQAPKKDNGLEIYQVKKRIPIFSTKPECYYCLDIKTEDLFDKPILTELDFIEFDFTNQQIKLTEEGRKKLKNIEIPLEGLPVAMLLNGEIIYGFWFWNIISSFGCDRVYSYPTLDFKIKFGLPESNTFGEDPRFDQRLEKYINKKIEN